MNMMPDFPSILTEERDIRLSPAPDDEGATLQTASSPKQPSHLILRGTLTLKTYFAHKHFFKLLSFAGKVKLIYQAAKQDDPYADFYLLKIEEALCDAKVSLEKSLALHQSIIASAPGLKMGLVDTHQSMTMPVYFGTPYAYLAVRVLLTLDEIVCCILSQKQLGFPLKQPIKAILWEMSQPWRQALLKANDWKSTGVTRQDVIQHTPLAEQVIKLLGTLDSRIIDQTQRSRLAPKIISSLQKNSIED